MSEYRIAIVHESGNAILLHPGSRGERDLVESVVAAAVAKDIGFLRTEAQVKKAIEDAFNEVLFNLKCEVCP